MAWGNDGERRRDKQSHYRRAALAHRLRRRILRLMVDGSEAGAGQIAAELDETLGRIVYHLRVLVRHDALRVVPRCRPVPPLYRRSPRGRWVRKMLDGDGE